MLTILKKTNKNYAIKTLLNVIKLIFVRGRNAIKVYISFLFTNQ